MSTRRDHEARGEHFVYRIFSKAGALLYIGCTENVETRMYMHLATTTMPEAYLTQRHYGHHTSERHPSRVAAREAERQAIASERPLFNRQHNPTRWVRVSGQYHPADEATASELNALTERREPDPETQAVFARLIGRLSA